MSKNLFILKFVFNDNNEITVTINKTISTDIINTDYYTDIDEVLVNGKSAKIYNYTALLDEGTNVLTIRFISPLDSCRSMFSGLINILFIDLSNFISKNVTDTTSMFSDCISLKSINLNGFDTSSLLYMNHMFAGCTSLLTLDLSNLNTSKVRAWEKFFLIAIH